MANKKLKAADILSGGKIVADWLCDIPCDNGGVENLVFYKDNYYIVVEEEATGETISYSEVDEEMLEEGFIADYIKEFESVVT